MICVQHVVFVVVAIQNASQVNAPAAKCDAAANLAHVSYFLLQAGTSIIVAKNRMHRIIVIMYVLYICDDTTAIHDEYILRKKKTR
jgi:hypothetical protein